MADFTTGMTDTTAVDDSIVLEFDTQFQIATGQDNVMDAFATYKRQIGAKSIQFTKYARLTLATTPLTEKEDPDSEALVDTEVTLTPAEHGNVVTKTRLASLQTGGKVDLGASRLVGINAGQTTDKLALLALDASTNELFPGSVANEAALVATDIAADELLNRAYNKLARRSVVGVPAANGDFVFVAHDDVIHDLRDGAASGSWLDVNKYDNPSLVLKNELGMYRGFRIVRDNLSTIGVDAGAANVDSYRSYAFGFNALGRAVSQDVHSVISGPFDKLKRFLNVGWLGTIKYLIVDQDALEVCVTASSVGDNA